MNPRHPRSVFLLLLPLLIGLTPGAGAGAPVAKPVTGAEAAFLRDNDTAMRRMMAGMEVRPTGDVDRDFARMMIPHHQGGIDMARALLRYGRNDRMRALARAIIVKQEEEIALMRRLSGEPAGAVPSRSMSMTGPMTMPGGADNRARK